MPHLEHEHTFDGAVCGVDEVGRGPWAGPVITCAVVLKNSTLPNEILSVLDDSKKLTDKKRQALYLPLKEHCHYAIGECSVAEIDKYNILQATMIAMTRAIESLKTPFVGVLIDGNHIPENLSVPAKCIIKGDSISLSIAAASVLAKVYRDTLMKNLAKEHPYYGWDTNAGYGTKTHKAGIEEYGITPHHRTSFAPIKKVLEGK